jgi:hypothetical protein
MSLNGGFCHTMEGFVMQSRVLSCSQLEYAIEGFLGPVRMGCQCWQTGLSAAKFTLIAGSQLAEVMNLAGWQTGMSAMTAHPYRALKDGAMPFFTLSLYS